MSYDHLVDRGMVKYYYINPDPTGVFPALKTGSYVSKLTALIESGHGKVDMDDESRRRVYAWIDPLYREMLKALTEAKTALEKRPRMDMPGGVAVPQDRKFGKVF